MRGGALATRLAQGDLPPGVRLLGAPGSNDPHRGNLVFRCSGEGGDAILKVYRRRGRLWSERLADFSQRWIEGKRGARAEQRCATERASFSAWRRHGFDVPRILDRKPPAWIGDGSCLWMEFIEGESLRDVLQGSGREREEQEALVARLSADSARRHRCALDTGETLLVQEHPAAQHVLVAGPRLVTFDLESAYRPGFPVETALAYEISSTLRSLRSCGPGGDAYFDVFVQAYGEPGVLRECCRLFLGASIGWRIYRAHETSRRGERSKTDAMRRLADRLGVRRRA